MFLSLPLDQWSQIKHIFLDWFSDPRRVLLPLGTISLVTIFLKAFPYRKAILRSTLGLSMAYLLLISPVGATVTTQGLTLLLSPDAGQSADAIIVLGRGRLAEQERAQAAAHLWQTKRAPIVLATGRGEAPRLSDKLVRFGVPLDNQLIEPEARTTEENAIHAYELLRAAGVNRLILITDQPHMLRSVLTFESFGFQVIPHPVDVPRTLPAIERTTIALREYAGLASYALIGRFRSRAAPVASIASGTKLASLPTSESFCAGTLSLQVCK